MEEKIKRRRLLIVWGVFFAWLLVLNLATAIGGQTDDSYFRSVGLAEGFTYGGWIDQMWFHWSSRLIASCLCVFFASSPYILWRLVNTAALFLVPFLLWRMTEAEGETEKNSVQTACAACGVFALLPYLVTGEAGWIATTVNYVFPASALLVCVYLLWKVAHEKRVAAWEWAVYLLAACVATDSEQGSFAMLALYAVFYGFMIWQKRTKGRKGILLFTVFAAGRLLMTFLSPGNIVRKGLIVKENYPAFGELNVFEKFLSGVYAVGSDTFLVFFALTVLMTVLLGGILWKEGRPLYQKLTFGVAAAAEVAFPVLVLLWTWKDYKAALPAGGTLFASLKNVLTALGILGFQNMIWDTLPLFFYIMLAVVFLCLFACIYWGAGKSWTGVVPVLVLLLGCCTKGAIAFSGSVWLSHSRTGYYLALAEMYVILKLYAKWKEGTRKRTQHIALWVAVPFVLANMAVSLATAMLYTRMG